MSSHLLINSLFKTVEYKLQHSDSLAITELSVSGANTKSVLLSKLDYEEGQTLPTFVSWLTLLLGFGTIGVAVYLSQSIPLLQDNLMNVVFFLGSVFCVLALILKPVKTQTYRDMHSKEVLFKLNNDRRINTATHTFIKDLNTAIEEAKELESNKINLKKNAQSQYELQHKNVDDLFNLGLIDEVLYKNICNSIHQKLFGTFNKHTTDDNVIYLNR